MALRVMGAGLLEGSPAVHHFAAWYQLSSQRGFASESRYLDRAPRTTSALDEEDIARAADGLRQFLKHDPVVTTRPGSHAC
jgi:hypothetical protein